MTAWCAAALAAALAFASCRGEARDAQPVAVMCEPAPVRGHGATVAREESGPVVSRVLFGEVASAPDGARRVEVALLREAGVTRLAVEAGHSAALPDALGCGALELRVDGRAVPTGAATARAGETGNGRREHVDVTLPAEALTALRGARCVAVGACGSVHPLFAEQVAALRRFVARP